MNEDEIEIDHDELNDIDLDLEHENEGGSATEPENDNGGSHSSVKELEVELESIPWSLQRRRRLAPQLRAYSESLSETQSIRGHHTVSTHAHTTRIRH